MDLPAYQDAEPSLPRQDLHRSHDRRRVAGRERKRAAKACDSCRRQKEKCDGGVPCRRCVRLRKQCEFGQHTLRGGNSEQDTPTRPHTSSTNFEPSDRVQNLEKLLRHYAGDINLDAGNLRDMADAIDKDRAITTRQESSSEMSDLEAEEEKFTVQPLGNNITHYSGEFSHWNFSMRVKQWIEHCANENPNSLEFREMYRAEELQSTSDTFASLSSLPPRFVAEFLIQAFFRHAETNYFYLDKRWLMEKLDAAYSNANSLTRRDVGTVCIIFIVLAIGVQYAYLDSPSQSSTGQDSSGTYSEDAISISFYQQACKLIPDVITVSSLESVQACLLIGIYALPLDASGLSYIYLNLGVKLAIQNGMHRKYPGEGLDLIVRETRNRVWWTVYTTERRVGIFHGRPVSIDRNDIDAEMPKDLPDIWPADHPTHIQSMLATLELHEILGRISQEISVLKSHAKSSPLDPLNRLANLKDELHRWWTKLPETICHKDPAPPSTLRRSQVHLRLEFDLVRMFTGRAFIFMRMPTRSGTSSSGSPGEASQSSPTSQASRKPPTTKSQTNRGSDIRNALVNDCVEAALDVVDACKTLRNTIGLARASYTEFSACRAAVLVIITQCLQGRTPRLRQALRDGVSMIKLMSSTGESARSEASLIEVFERAIARLEASEGAAATAPTENEYDRFKKWEMLWNNESPNTTNATTISGSREERVPSTNDPMPPPQMNGFWGSDSHLGRSAMIPTQAANPATTAMDWDFVSFPQMVDEFSSMFGQGFGPSPTGPGGQGPTQHNAWMGS